MNASTKAIADETPASGESALVPAKIIFERRAKPGAKAEVEAWIGKLEGLARATGKLQGSTVLAAGDDEYFVVLRFASQGDLDRWSATPEVDDLLKRGHAHAVDAASPVVRSGFETWFRLPGHAASPGAPENWKIAILTWSALLPQVYLLSFVVPPGLPPIVGMAISTAIPTCALTWVVMPFLTKAFYGWLFGSAPPTASTPSTPTSLEMRRRELLEQARNLGLLFLRIGAAAMIWNYHMRPKLEHFADELQHFPDPLGIGHQASFFSALGSEGACSLVVLVGFATRFACLPIVFTMAMVLVLGARGFEGADVQSALLYALPYAMLLLTGPGKYSVDHRLSAVYESLFARLAKRFRPNEA